ncbi:MAG: dihydrodipicolinate reductase [Verrucomicrobiota bacterium]|nr:dihydrodipicolinate reductase [Verrucomicrobiota bacterium]MCC6823157.1 dihydrodipicolinate reductase [Limisphaerales bacterium]
MSKIKIAQFGLGPIGLETLKLAATKPWVEIVGGIDIDRDKIGRPLAEVTGDPTIRHASVHRSLDELLAKVKPDVIFHTAVSTVSAAFAQVEPMVRHGINVVSSCEELLFPQLREPELAVRLDKACKDGGARLLGTGVNPGFVMDVLPVCLTGVCRQVTAVHIQRVVNAATRRGPLQKKIGSGLAPAEFEQRFQEGRAGHAGLQESAALIAHCLGWKLTELVETGKAMVASHDIRTRFVEVKKGQCCGLHQTAIGKVDGTIRLTLDIKMYLDAPNPHDACQIEGDPPLNLLINGGVAGDGATVAALVNAAPRILKAPPGLLLMTDIGVPSFA